VQGLGFRVQDIGLIVKGEAFGFKGIWIRL
jgi:hypothetical protein